MNALVNQTTLEKVFYRGDVVSDVTGMCGMVRGMLGPYVFVAWESGDIGKIDRDWLTLIRRGTDI